MAIPTTRWRPLIEAVATDYPPLDPVVFEAMVYAESEGDPKAQSDSDARGLAQVIYHWHKGLVEEVALSLGHVGGAASLFIPEVCLRVGARHLVWCYTADDPAKRTWERAVRRYHLGSYDPPAGQTDGQGTTSEAHIRRYREKLALVRADRGLSQETPAMAISIRQKVIPAGNPNFPGSLLNAGPLYITVHETGNLNPGADAAHEATFLQNGGGSDNVAFHFAVDHKGAYQCLKLNRIGWHAGDGCNDRVGDVGCFASVAIETCVGDNNAHKVATRKNLLQLIAAICSGDRQIDYGGTDPKRFSPQRIAPHKRWSSYSKDCPRFMLADGYFWTIATNVGAILAKGDGTAGPAPIYAERAPEPLLAPYKSGDFNTIPAFVVHPDGTRFWFVGDRVKAIRETPRLQKAYDGAPVLGEDIEPGEEFDVDWIFIADDGREYYYTPWDTRVLVADTQRVADRRVAA